MSVTESQHGAVTILSLDGRLDAETAPTLETHVAGVIARDLAHGVAPRMVIDCGGLAYISSAGVRAILIAARQIGAAGGALVIAAVAPAVHQIFTVAGLAKVLTITATVDDGRAALDAQALQPPAAAAPATVTHDVPGLTLMEELALLAIDQNSGRLVAESAVAFHCALAGAAVADLAFMGRLDADLEQFVVVDATPTGHPLLDTILKSISADASNRRVDSWLTAIGARGQELADRTFDRLVDHGILRRDDTRLLWVFTGHRYRTVDGHERQEVKGRLTSLILSDDVPDVRDAVLLGLLEAAGLTDRVFTDASVRARRDRIDAVAHLDIVGAQVTRAVDRLLESLNMAISMFRVV